ncbi:MAG: aspartate aminotransferase family protein [Myxococcota bacterium]
MTGQDLPAIGTPLPGPRSRALVDTLAQHECPAITARRARRAATLGAADDDPVVWDEALGANVRDVDGNVFVDLTSGFGVALLGHRDPEVVAAASAQAQRLVHAMGDAWPDATRVALLERLAAFGGDGLSVALLGLSGSDAVDAAVKTAVLATGRTGVLAFGGAYHGLSLGVLGLQGYEPAFTEPFRPITHPDVQRLPYGAPLDPARALLETGRIGLVLVEPVLGRGGIRVPPDGWLAELGALARRAGALVCHDEIQTGLGRTGVPFAGPAAGAVPDLRCVGKALGGGFPLSACCGTPEVMAAWAPSTGQAIHTQTFLGHPIGCAAALAVLRRTDADTLAAVRARGGALRDALVGAGFAVRGAGLMRAVTVGRGRALSVSRQLVQRGFLVLPADGDSLSLTPPLPLSDAQIGALAEALVSCS